ncbi:MAG: nicotinate phosphoribosyltransferase [Desulfobacteraceae bacterium]|nr:nicotinate phosphoribosyltransferase [Desulfobacteraceae bacterium]
MTPISPLLTDLYELTMAAAYFKQGIEAPATFSLYTRRHPLRGYFVAAGLEAILAFVEDLRFGTEDIDYLRNTGLFEEAFLSYLSALRFEGDIWALPEGTIFFADEPILEVTAPIIQSQILETILINAVGLATLIATKAARCVHAAQGRSLIDFSLRRTQGADAGLTVARSSYLAGFDATSNVLAGKQYGIPIAGTMAHSFVMAFEREIDAFRAYARLFPQRTLLLVDTYDTLVGARNAAQVAQEMRIQGHPLVGVRLDSGDLNALSRQVRAILDQADCKEVKIFASGGLDEYTLDQLLRQNAPIDAFGVGTSMGVSADAPYLDMVYKMVQFNGQPVRKRSFGKATLAGEKQIFRCASREGEYVEDVIALRSETMPEGYPLLQPVMRAGHRLHPPADLVELRSLFQQNFKLLAQAYKGLTNPPRYPVGLSRQLMEMQDY